MKTFSLATGLLLATVMAATTVTAARAAGSDAPADYSHLLPLTAASSQGVLQVRLPRDVYLHARSPLLNDVRVFDARGLPQPFALRPVTVASSTSHIDAPLTIFPLMGAGAAAAQLDLDVRTATDGRLLSVKVRPTPDSTPGAGQSVQPPRLAGLILDLGQRARTTQPAPQYNALRFTLPPGQRDYSAQVWLETSDDMKRWEAVGAAELNWLVNQDAQTLANDRLDFVARPFRYARLTWRSGAPLQFAAIVAEQPVQTRAAPPAEQLLVQPVAGEQPQDLVYPTPPAIAPTTVGLQFGASNVVLPALLGIYRTVPARQAGSTVRRFDPVVNTTFYRITQDGQTRSSGDLDVPPLHATQWVLRTNAGANLVSIKPTLRLGWQPATLVFLASGNAPYTLAVGRERAVAAERPLDQVAPGFSDAELQKVERATAGPATVQEGAQATTVEENVDAQRRLLVLWGVLLLGTGALAFMVWRLLRPKV
jgi:hypothetical protein